MPRTASRLLLLLAKAIKAIWSVFTDFWNTSTRIWGTVEGSLLSEYGGAAAAYSLRILSASTTNVVKVRRSGDDAELDFTASEVSDGTLAAWVVAGGGTEDGFVTTWYDQSGNGKNATQATAANQPKIVSSGTLVTENGKAALDFDGTNDAFNISVANDFFGINDISAYFVTKNATSSETGGIMQKRTAVTDGNFGVGASGGTYQFQTRDTGTADIVLNTVSTYSTQELISIIRNSSGLEMFSPEQITQSDTVADLTSTGALEIGTGPSYGNLDGVIQEIILYLSDQSANRTGIEANINDYYNIYP